MSQRQRVYFTELLRGKEAWILIFPLRHSSFLSSIMNIEKISNVVERVHLRMRGSRQGGVLWCQRKRNLYDQAGWSVNEISNRMRNSETYLEPTLFFVVVGEATTIKYHPEPSLHTKWLRAFQTLIHRLNSCLHNLLEQKMVFQTGDTPSEDWEIHVPN